MELCKNWAVAAVYLLENQAGYLEDIKDYIIEKNVSKLGGITPDSTIRNALQTTNIDGDPVFRQEDPKDDPNYYSLWNEDEIKKCAEVKRVRERLEWKENIRNLKERIGLVEQEISRAKQLCDEML